MKPSIRWLLIAVGAIVAIGLLIHGCKKVHHYCESQTGEE